MGVEESIRTLLLQAVEESYLEALKEEYIGYGGRTPFEMIEHLRTKISKVTNKEKVLLKKEVFIMWEFSNAAWFTLSLTFDSSQVTLAISGLECFTRKNNILIQDQNCFLSSAESFYYNL